MPQQDIQTVIKDPKFLALDGDSQVQVLQHMQSLQPAAASTSQSTGTPPPPPDPDDTPGAIGATVDVLKNVGKRGYDMLKGAAKSVLPQTPAEGVMAAMPGALPIYRMWQGETGAAKNAVQQTGQQLADANASQGGDPTITALKYARAGVTGLSALNPLATGTVTDINAAENEGRNREAIGTGLFDGLMLLAGGKFKGKAGAAQSELNAKATAIGKTGETVANLRPVMDDLAETARQQGGVPDQTIGGELKLVQDTISRIGAPIDQQIQAIGQQMVHPTDLGNNLRRMAREPGLVRTAEGRAKIAALNDAYNTYAFQPWSIEEMAAETQRLRQQIKSYYDMNSTAQRSALMTDADLQIKKMVADRYSEEINNALHQANPNAPPGYYQAQRQKQARLVDLKTEIEKRVGNLEDKQAEHDARGPLGRMNAHAYAAGGGVRAHISGLSEALGSGPMAEANEMVRKSRGGLPPRTAILALPVGHLATMPPPPQDSDNQ